MMEAAAGEATVHGMQAEPAAPDWPRLGQGELDALARELPVLLGASRPLWHSPRPFSAAARVQTAHGEFFVKRHDARVRDVASLEEEHRFLGHLRAQALAVPRVVPGRSGATAIAMAGWTYEVHELAAGVDLYRDAHSWTPVRGAHHARALGRALAQLHLAAAGYQAPARLPRPLLASFDIVGAADLAASLDRFVNARPAVAAYLGASGWRDRMLGALGPAHARLRPLLPALAPCWVHNDWHASNVFWTDRSAQAQVQSVIDFGLSNLGVAVADLATALERNTIAWLELDEQAAAGAGAGGVGSAPLAQALLDGYCGVRPLDSTERQALLPLLALAHVEYALSEVDYFHGVVGNAFNASLAYHKFLLGHVQWFAGRHGREYLAALRRWLRGAGTQTSVPA